MFRKVCSELHFKTSPGRLFQMKGAEYEYERLANSVFVLGIVSSGSTVDRVWRVATCWLYLGVTSLAALLHNDRFCYEIWKLHVKQFKCSDGACKKVWGCIPIVFHWTILHLFICGTNQWKWNTGEMLILQHTVLDSTFSFLGNSLICLSPICQFSLAVVTAATALQPPLHSHPPRWWSHANIMLPTPAKQFTVVGQMLPNALVTQKYFILLTSLVAQLPYIRSTVMGPHRVTR